MVIPFTNQAVQKKQWEKKFLFKIKLVKLTSAQLGVGKGSPPTLLVGTYISSSLYGTVWRFLRKLKIELPEDLAIPLLGNTHTKL